MFVFPMCEGILSGLTFVTEKQIEDDLIAADRTLALQGKDSGIFALGEAVGIWKSDQFPYRKGMASFEGDESSTAPTENRETRRMAAREKKKP